MFLSPREIRNLTRFSPSYDMFKLDYKNTEYLVNIISGRIYSLKAENDALSNDER